MLFDHDLVWAAEEWPSNADLIADVAKLGYIRGMVCDLTFGLGTWWKRLPASVSVLLCNDIDPTIQGVRHEDFRHTTLPDNHFDVVAFDPPYVSIGGRSTTTIEEHHARYGMGASERTPELNQRMINDGLTEAVRLCKPGGIILVKAMNYVSSGQLWPGANNTWLWGAQLGLRLEEQFIHVGRPGRNSQGAQVHARNNYSVLFVFRKLRG